MHKKFISAVYVATACLASVTAHAQGTDNAASPAYSSGMAGQNGGSGFGPFTVSAVNGAGGTAPYSGTFIGTAVNSEGSSGTPAPVTIDTSSKSFGFYANGDPTASVTITRAFNTPLSPGRSFSMDLVPGYNDGGYVGVSLNNGFGDFRYQSGGAGFLFNGASTGIGFTSGALHLTYTVLGPGTYSFTTSGAFNYSNTGTFTGSLSGFSVFQAAAGGGGDHDGFFNNLQVSAAPEPGGGVPLLMGAAGLCGAVVVRRRRQTP